MLIGLLFLAGGGKGRWRRVNGVDDVDGVDGVDADDDADGADDVDDVDADDDFKSKKTCCRIYICIFVIVPIRWLSLPIPSHVTLP